MCQNFEMKLVGLKIKHILLSVCEANMNICLSSYSPEQSTIIIANLFFFVIGAITGQLCRCLNVYIKLNLNIIVLKLM